MSKMKAENCSWAHIENVNIVCNLCLPFPFVASSALRPRLLCVTTTGLGGNKMFFFLLRCDFLPKEVTQHTMAKQKQKWRIDSLRTLYRYIWLMQPEARVNSKHAIVSAKKSQGNNPQEAGKKMLELCCKAIIAWCKIQHIYFSITWWKLLFLENHLQQPSIF